MLEEASLIGWHRVRHVDRDPPDAALEAWVTAPGLQVLALVGAARQIPSIASTAVDRILPQGRDRSVA